MPLSTNAPHNKFGHAMVLRDIEYLYLKLQELYRISGVNDGDLNPGGGVGVSQEVPDDAWGAVPGEDGDRLDVAHMVLTVPATALTTGQRCQASSIESDPTASWDSVAHQFTIPRDGVYRVDVSASTAAASAGALVAGSALFVYRNGLQLGMSSGQTKTNTIGGSMTNSMATVYAGPMRAGDVIHVELSFNGAISWTGSGGLTIQRVGDA